MTVLFTPMLPGASMVSYMSPLYQITRSHKEAVTRPRTCSPAPKTMSNFRGKSEQTRANWPPEPEYTDASGELVAKAVLDEAKQASEEIDHSLSVERSRRRKDRAIRIVLLGMYAHLLPYIIVNHSSHFATLARFIIYFHVGIPH